MSEIKSKYSEFGKYAKWEREREEENRKLLSEKSKHENRFDNLLSKYSELERETEKILAEFNFIISGPLDDNDPQRCDKLKHKFDKNHTKSAKLLDKLQDLLGITDEDYWRLMTIEEKDNALCDKDDEICAAYEKLKKLISEKKRDNEKPQKLTRTKRTDENLGTKAALCLGSILALSFAYLTSKKNFFLIFFKILKSNLYNKG